MLRAPGEARLDRQPAREQAIDLGPAHMPHRAFFAVYWLLRAARQMIEHFRAGENLTWWYLREIQTPFFAPQRLRVVPNDETDTKG